MRKRILLAALLLLSLTWSAPATAASITAAAVTLTSASTNYNLLTLLNGVDTRIGDDYIEATLCADVANTAAVYVGDSSLSATRYGVSLAATDCITFRVIDRSDSIHASLFYVRSGSASQVVDFVGRSK